MEGEPAPSKTEPGTMVEELESLIDFCDRRGEYYLERGTGGKNNRRPRAEKQADFIELKGELRRLLEKYKESDVEYCVEEELNKLALSRFDLRSGNFDEEPLHKKVSRLDVFKEIQKRLIAYTGSIGDKTLGVAEEWEERYGGEVSE